MSKNVFLVKTDSTVNYNIVNRGKYSFCPSIKIKKSEKVWKIPYILNKKFSDNVNRYLGNVQDVKLTSWTKSKI